MRALFATKMGGDRPLDNFTVGERPDPTPGRGEVRVRMRAATLNHHDYWTLRGVVGYPIALPRILGCDGCGEVESYGPERPAGTPDVGAPVVLYPVRFCGRCEACLGDDPMLCRSFTMLSDAEREGSFAEFVVLPALHAIPKPDYLSDVEAAALPVTFLTAYRMLFVKAALRPGDSVLIQAATGGLGVATILLAVAAGLTVFASSRSQERLSAIKRFGAQHLVVAGKDAAKEILRQTAGNGVDAVMESVGEATWGTSVRAVRQGGAIVVSGATSGPNPPADLARIFWRQLRVLGSTMGSLPEFLRMIRFMEDKSIKPPIDHVYELSEAGKAFERLAAGTQVGKIALRL